MQPQIVRSLRRPTRRRVHVNWQAEIRFLRHRRACRVIDISPTGAHVAIEAIPHNITEVRLLLEAGPPIPARLAWRQSGRVGLSFTVEQEWIGEMHKGRSDSADWVR